jgi:hypothetical protein
MPVISITCVDFTAKFGLDQRRQELRNPSGEEVPLMKGAFAPLVAFLEAPGRPLSREHRWPATRMREHIFGRSIDVQVLRLRRKLEPDPTAPREGRRILLADEGAGDWASRAASHRLCLAQAVTCRPLAVPNSRAGGQAVLLTRIASHRSSAHCSPPVRAARL